MARSDLRCLRVLGALLAYPSAALRAALPEIAAALRDERLIPVQQRPALLGFCELLAAADPLWTEERYVELFDRGRATSLHLFEHVHGDTRDRGNAMVELKALYRQAGFELDAKELPDYLPVMLEYLSYRDLGETKEMLGDCAHILRRIGEALYQRNSLYAAIFQALLSIAGEAGLDTKANPPKTAEAEDLDADWFEQPAFAPDAATSARTRSCS